MHLVVVAAVCLLSRDARAHDFEVHLLSPSENWCDAVHAVAAPGDVVEFLPGVYDGPCVLTTGGHVEENEPLILKAATEQWPVFEPGPQGLTIVGETTRLYQLDIRGDVVADAFRVTLDTLRISGSIEAQGARFQLLYSDVAGSIHQEGDFGIVRGSRLGSTVQIRAGDGLVADNTFADSADVQSGRVVRNLFSGAAHVDGLIAANVGVAALTGSGLLAGNTLLGDVSFDGLTLNNAITQTTLGPNDIVCDSGCFADLEALDLRPSGPLLGASVGNEHESDGDFCQRPRSGAAGALEDADSPGPLGADSKSRGECVLPTVREPVQEGEVVGRGCATAERWGFVHSLMALVSRRN